jgi:putative phosphoesterase
MRVGVISDIHGNRIALETVLEDIGDRNVDTLLCAGDVVGYNPWPAACLDAVRERAIPTVMGNHDRAVASGTAFRFNGMARAGVEYAREQLDGAAIDWLEALPDERGTFDGQVQMVHGHPEDPDHYTYAEEFEAAHQSADAPVLIMGHTHVQSHTVVETEAGKRGIAMNPGSVGQPRDGDPRAAYAVLDLDAMAVEEHRVAYDIDRVIEAVRETGLPERIGSRLQNGQ